eukprot:scaffold6034_cov87-Skeletonema_dohrnii-CCMP3373.AAC.1
MPWLIASRTVTSIVAMVRRAAVAVRPFLGLDIVRRAEDSMLPIQIIQSNCRRKKMDDDGRHCEEDGRFNEIILIICPILRQ